MGCCAVEPDVSGVLNAYVIIALSPMKGEVNISETAQHPRRQSSSYSHEISEKGTDQISQKEEA
jgi:hypothetical protein